MLNIGLLAPGAGEYYIGQVASSAEDYYTGAGESAGRWTGSLAKEMGLEGEVDPDDFRAVLGGRDPHSGEQLVHRKTAAAVSPSDLDPEQSFDVLQAASVLGVSGQYVRRLLQEGDRYMAELVESDGTGVAAPTAFLIGEHTRDPNRDPDMPKPMGPVPWRITGHELARFIDSRHHKKFRPGYDLTFRPPKSVSVLWALGGPDIAREVRDAHTAAVDQAVRYVERHAIKARKPKTGARVATDGVIAAAFDHRTSRAGDPLLHTHVVTVNMTRFDEGVTVHWRAVEFSAVFDHAKSAGCLYQAHLRHELVARLGVRFTPVAYGHAEIDGIPDTVIDVFSKRRHEIEEELAATGRSTARSAQVATLETRKAKDYSVDPDTLTDRWTAEAAAVGFDLAVARTCVGRTHPTELTQQQQGGILDLLASPHGLTERASTFRRSDVVEAIASMTGSNASATDIEKLTDEFLSSDRVVKIDRSGAETSARSSARLSLRRSGQILWTTVDLAELEAGLLARADRPVRYHQSVDASTVSDVIAVRAELSDEQATMVTAVCRDSRFLMPVEGRPGAGKTYAMEAVVAAHVAGRVPIVGCAVTAAAAAELESQAGFARSTMPATTVAKLLVDLDRFDQLANGATVVVDEATMIGTRDLARLAAHVDRAGGRIVMVGDPDQHGAVIAGGLFTHLCRERGYEPVQLVENRRQADHVDRLAIDDYRNGLITDAVQRLDDTDRVVRSATAGESFDAMVADWYTARLGGTADPMIAGPNSTRRALNERARVLLKANGELTGPVVTVHGREFQVGDAVVARRNDRTLHASGSKDFVKNGSLGTITAVHLDHHEVTVTFDREGTIRLPNTYLEAGRLDHGYALTTYGVQGHTHDVARYHPTDASGFEEGYVAVTRGRRGARLYIVDGTITTDTDEHHQQRSLERHGLDEITAAFGRRRANTTANTDGSHLEQVAHLAATTSLAQLHRRRLELDRQMASAPPDAAAVIEESKTARDALLARRRTLTTTTGGRVSEDLEGRISHLDQRITTATTQQAARERWIEDHSGLITEHRVVRDAERDVEARIRQDPLVHLPRHVTDTLGPEPALQRHNTAWTATAEAIAVYRRRHDVADDDGRHLHGAARQLGERPTDRPTAARWDHAAVIIAKLEQNLESARVSGVAR